MPFLRGIIFFFSFYTAFLAAQLPVARDTIHVQHAGRTLAMPWAGGVNSSNVSNIDLNFDQVPDLVFFEKQNIYSIGRFRCFVHSGSAGDLSYTFSPDLSYLFPEVSNWAVLRDYDGDGRADIFCSTSSGIKVYRNVSTPQNKLKFDLASSLLYSNYYPQLSPPLTSNLYAGSAGPAGIADIDNDGDFDILTFTPLGVYLELHRNMSQELYGHSDSLVYQRDEECWGGVSESECTINFELCGSRLQEPEKQPLHAGACIACIDNDGDADMDLIMGDMNCDFVQYVHNSGTAGNADFTDTTRLYPNYPLKNSGNPAIRISHFPCAYPVDADADGRLDLIATPNAITDNFNSVWLYHNTSASGTVNFQLVQKNFLQDEMIDVGQNAFPVLFDYDGDGKRDLLVGTQGYFSGGVLSAQLTLYKNTGTTSAPSFSLVTRDYLGLAAENLNACIPAPGDVDADGDIDICIGTSPGQVHWLENTAGAGNPPAFGPMKTNPFQFTTPSAAAAPQLFDLDEDGKQDLLIGMKNGRIAYYKNTSSASQVSFSLITSALGNVDVKSDPTRYGFDGYATPFFYREGGKSFVLCGSVEGSIFLYEITDPGSDFQLLTGRINGYREGAQSTPWFEDINGDGIRDLFVGNAAGGLSFFSSTSPEVALPEFSTDQAPGFLLFPNPASESLTLKTGIVGYRITGAFVSDMSGRPMALCEMREGNLLDVSALEPGIYLITVTMSRGTTQLSGRRIFVKE